MKHETSQLARETTRDKRMGLVSIGRLDRSSNNLQALQTKFPCQAFRNGRTGKALEYADQSRNGDSAASGGVGEPLCFCLLNPQVTG